MQRGTKQGWGRAVTAAVRLEKKLDDAEENAEAKYRSDEPVEYSEGIAAIVCAVFATPARGCIRVSRTPAWASSDIGRVEHGALIVWDFLAPSHVC